MRILLGMDVAGAGQLPASSEKGWGWGAVSIATAGLVSRGLARQAAMRPGVHGYTDSAEQCLAACRRPCVIGLTRQAAGPGLNSGAELSVPARLDNELLYARRPLIIALQRELWQGRQSTVFPDEHLLRGRALLLTEILAGFAMMKTGVY
jgi:hypothetical protein